MDQQSLDTESFGSLPKTTQALISIGAQMSFRRFNVCVRYILKNSIRRAHPAFVEEDPSCARLQYFLNAFRDACIYVPVDASAYTIAAEALLRDNNLAHPKGFRASPTQCLINAQIARIARRVTRGWSIDLEAEYSGSAYRSDVKVTATPHEEDDDQPFQPFAIWIETDKAKTKSKDLRSKFASKVTVIGPADAYVAFIYADAEHWKYIENTAMALYDEMARRFSQCGNSFAVLSLDAPSIYTGVQDTVVNAHLMHDGNSVQVAEFSFVGPDSWVLNEFVTDASGKRYPHRDAPPPFKPQLPRLGQILGKLLPSPRPIEQPQPSHNA